MNVFTLRSNQRLPFTDVVRIVKKIDDKKTTVVKKSGYQFEQDYTVSDALFPQTKYTLTLMCFSVILAVISSVSKAIFFVC